MHVVFFLGFLCHFGLFFARLRKNSTLWVIYRGVIEAGGGISYHPLPLYGPKRIIWPPKVSYWEGVLRGRGYISPFKKWLGFKSVQKIYWPSGWGVYIGGGGKAWWGRLPCPPPKHHPLLYLLPGGVSFHGGEATEENCCLFPKWKFGPPLLYLHPGFFRPRGGQLVGHWPFMSQHQCRLHGQLLSAPYYNTKIRIFFSPFLTNSTNDLKIGDWLVP